MRFTWDKDTRTAAAGAAIALSCGVMLGGAMRPDLGDDGRPAGPQQINGWAGVRSTGPFDTEPAPVLASYAGPVPDYVLGTDWKRAMNPPSEPAAVSPPAARRVAYDADDEVLPTPALKAAWAEPARRPAPYDDDARPPPRSRYPSLGGDAAPGDDEEADGPAAPATG